MTKVISDIKPAIKHLPFFFFFSFHLNQCKSTARMTLYVFYTVNAQKISRILNNNLDVLCKCSEQHELSQIGYIGSYI